ncbi:MAG: hypothetical protein P0S95_01325 [Rhabdochlamydiaceae bacterium]|nr:hypothetical protein [Candidatus Amphrikana amoebophyrae]
MSGVVGSGESPVKTCAERAQEAVSSKAFKKALVISALVLLVLAGGYFLAAGIVGAAALGLVVSISSKALIGMGSALVGVPALGVLVNRAMISLHNQKWYKRKKVAIERVVSQLKQMDYSDRIRENVSRVLKNGNNFDPDLVDYVTAQAVVDDAKVEFSGDLLSEDHTREDRLPAQLTAISKAVNDFRLEGRLLYCQDSEFDYGILMRELYAHAKVDDKPYEKNKGDVFSVLIMFMANRAFNPFENSELNSTYLIPFGLAPVVNKEGRSFDIKHLSQERALFEVTGEIGIGDSTDINMDGRFDDKAIVKYKFKMTYTITKDPDGGPCTVEIKRDLQRIS